MIYEVPDSLIDHGYYAHRPINPGFMLSAQFGDWVKAHFDKVQLLTVTRDAGTVVLCISIDDPVVAISFLALTPHVLH